MKRSDNDYMRIAIRIAKRNQGFTGQNPSIGAVIVDKNGFVISTGGTGIGGTPHAEIIAIENCKKDLFGATMFVTLEPCSHFGKTPPCVDRVISSGIKKVVFAAKDPNPKAANGRQKLEEFGVEVVEGILINESREVNKGFFSVFESGRPYISLKIATSMDGKIATSTGESKWITGDDSRRYGHLLRARNDAILVGKNTFIHDKPSLNCRIEGLEVQSPVPIVMGVDILQNEYQNPQELMDVFCQRGFYNILIEGGAGIATYFLKNNLVNRIYHFTSSKIIGGDGLSFVGELGLNNIPEAAFKAKEIVSFEKDILVIYERD